MAEAVVRQAIEDLANGFEDARSFIESYHFDLWCRLAGLDASKIRELLPKYTK